MANLLSIFKLSSNITDIFHPHSEKPASGYSSNSLLLPEKDCLHSSLQRPITTKPNTRHF